MKSWWQATATGHGATHAGERPVVLMGLVLLALAIRLPFVPVDFRPTSDLDVYRLWARSIAEHGLASVYEEAGANYPPLLLYAFGAAGEVAGRLAQGHEDAWLTALLKLPAAVADILTAALLAWAARARGPAVSRLVFIGYAFNPAVWYVSAYWGQTDAVYALFLLAAVVMLTRQSFGLAWAAYALALGTKIQSLALAPLLLVATLAMRPRWQETARGLGAAGLTALLLAAPWLAAGRGLELVHAATTLPNQIPRLSVSAYNLWFLLRLGRVHLVPATGYPAGLPFSYRAISLALLAGWLLFVACLTYRWRGRRLAALAALSALGLFMLPSDVHERYLFPALPFLLLAAVEDHAPGGGEERLRRRPRAYLLAYLVLSATFFYNLVTVAPFTPALGGNLIVDIVMERSPRTALLQGIALLAAAANLLVGVRLAMNLSGRR